MKIFPLVMLSLLVFPVKAESLLSALEQNQSSLPAAAGVSVPKSPTGVTAPTVRPSETNAQCTESKQTSLPLKYLTALILQKDAQLNIDQNPEAGTITVSSPAKMIGNCNSMLDWKVRENEMDGKKAYAVEVSFKEGEACPATVTDAGDKKCFRLTKVGADGLPTYETKAFSNDIQGFQKCLEVSGVVGADGKINQAAIYKQPVSQTFSGMEETGKLMFLSHGPVSSQIDPRFGLERVNGCDVYEKIHPTISMVYSSSDLANNRVATEGDSLRNCTPNEYQRLVDFIERNHIQSDLNDIRDNLIKQAAQALAKKIAENKELTDEDMKVLADFERFIVEPQRQKVADIFNSLANLEGSELQAARANLNAERTKLLDLAKAPYFQKAHFDKLIAKGMFADAERMEGIRIAVQEGAKVGTKNGSVTITPDMARVSIANARGTLATQITTARENYDIRTGVTTGMAQSYRDLANAMNRNIEKRTQNYSAEMQSEYARIQPGGYCYKYFRNTQKCIQDSVERIQELQNSLKHYNDIDAQRSAEFAQKATEYAALEAEGRRYQASQNGEAAPAEQPVDTTVVPPRTDTASMPGQIPGQQIPGQQFPGGQQSMMPPWLMNQTQPYGNQTMMNMQQNPYGSMYGQSSPLLGQAGFQANFGYQGTMGQNYMGMQQPQYGAVGMNWFQMGQQGMMGQQPMYGQQPGMFGMQQPMYGQNPMMGSPYGQMYAQSPYMQPGMGMQQPGMMGGMNMGMSYPNFYGR